MQFTDWLHSLGYTEFTHDLVTSGRAAGTRPYASEIEDMLAPRGTISASGVFCVGEVPTICILDGQTLGGSREDRIEKVRQRVWNQNLVSVVLVLDPDRLSAYSVNKRTAEPD